MTRAGHTALAGYTVLAVLGALLVLALAVGIASPVSAQDGVGGATGAGEPSPQPEIIPRANSGSAPVDAGDRGGSLQLAVFGAVVVALAGGTALVVREARRGRAGPG